MSANTPTAVMQRREPVRDTDHGPRGFPKPLDYFPTPPWAERAACAFLREELGEGIERQVAWEPACGEGHMVRGLADCFGTAEITLPPMTVSRAEARWAEAVLGRERWK